MTAEQEAAFLLGSGGFLPPGYLLLIIQACGATAVFCYAAWLSVRAYNEYGEGEMDAKDLIWVWLRSVVIMMVVLYLILPEANILPN